MASPRDLAALLKPGMPSNPALAWHPALTGAEQYGGAMEPAQKPDVAGLVQALGSAGDAMGGPLTDRLAAHGAQQQSRFQAGDARPTPMTAETMDLADSMAGALMGSIQGVGKAGRALSKLQPRLVADDHPKAWVNNMTVKRDLHRGELVSVPVLRRIGDKGSPPTITIEDGQVVLTASEFAADDRIQRYIDDWVKPFGDDVFVRSTNSPDDIKHLKSGTHRGSRNHRDDIEEGGLSVARTLEFPAKYQYLVKGKVIGQGTDGEPLLDISSVQPISKPMSASDMQDLQKAKIKERMEAMGLSEEDYRAISSGARVVRGGGK